jgi:hypothetical protein
MYVMESIDRSIQVLSVKLMLYVEGSYFSTALATRGVEMFRPLETIFQHRHVKRLVVIKPLASL